MRRMFFICVLGIFPLVFFASSLRGSEKPSPLHRLERALAREKGLSQETKDAIKSAIGATQNKPSKSSGGSTWWEKAFSRLSLYGDFRFRWESTFVANGPDRHRPRLRFRSGAKYEIFKGMEIGIRMRTGNTNDPNSPHQTLGNIFNSYAVGLDRLYLNYKPEFLKGAFFTLGKFHLPLYQNPVYGELIWDDDVQPEGLAMGYSKKFKGILKKLQFTFLELLINENATKSDPSATVVQLATKMGLGKKMTLNFASNYYWYTNPTPNGNDIVVGDNAGNAVTADVNGNGIPDHFASNFGIFDTVLALTIEGKYPLTFSAEYIQNLRATGSYDQGWALGFSLGKAKKKGDWKVYYQWNVVQQDAVFSPFAQDDLPLQTNHRSHYVGLKYMLANRVQIHGWAMIYRRDLGSNRDNIRARVDVNIKF